MATAIIAISTFVLFADRVGSVFAAPVRQGPHHSAPDTVTAARLLRSWISEAYPETSLSGFSNGHFYEEHHWDEGVLLGEITTDLNEQLVATDVWASPVFSNGVVVGLLVADHSGDPDWLMSGAIRDTDVANGLAGLQATDVLVEESALGGLYAIQGGQQVVGVNSAGMQTTPSPVPLNTYRQQMVFRYQERRSGDTGEYRGGGPATGRATGDSFGIGQDELLITLAFLLAVIVAVLVWRRAHSTAR